MALERGTIKLTDPVTKHWPLLTNPQWQNINMQHLATYTAGGLPLMIPNTVTDPVIQAALIRAQQQYAKAGEMLQGLGWEMLDYPVQLSVLQAVTDPSFASGSPARIMDPPAATRSHRWVHKTGSTGGFGAYAAFIPSRQVGIVILANQRYPNALRVALAHQLLAHLQ